MLETICKRIMDILQADARLIRGSAGGYAPGFSAVKRINSADIPVAGAVNLFDHVWEPDSSDARPAIYVGMKGQEAWDELDFPTASSVRIEYRIAKIPLVIVCEGPDHITSRRSRNQLRANLKYILLDNIRELSANMWYELTMPGSQGGGDLREQMWNSTTGGAGQGISQAACVVPVKVRYQFITGGVLA